MFIAWGHKSQQRAFANAGDFHCNNCGQEQRSTVVLGYTVRHLWYLFRWSTGKVWHTVCETCGQGQRLLNAKTFEASLSRPPIPFIDRRGWLVGLAILGGLIAMVAVSAAADRKNDLAYLRAPRVGDVYEMDYGRDSSNTTCPDCQYGAALVSAIDDKGVYIHPGKKIYNRSSDVPMANDPAEYAVAETYFIPNEKLLEMRQNGKMLNVQR